MTSPERVIYTSEQALTRMYARWTPYVSGRGRVQVTSPTSSDVVVVTLQKKLGDGGLGGGTTASSAAAAGPQARGNERQQSKAAKRASSRRDVSGARLHTAATTAEVLSVARDAGLTVERLAGFDEARLPLVGHLDGHALRAWARLMAGPAVKGDGKTHLAHHHRMVDTALDVGSPEVMKALSRVFILQRAAIRPAAPAGLAPPPSLSPSPPPSPPWHPAQGDEPSAAFVAAWADSQRTDAAVSTQQLLHRVKLIALQHAREAYELSRRSDGQTINASPLCPDGGVLQHLFKATHPGLPYSANASPEARTFRFQLRLAQRWTMLADVFGAGVVFAVLLPSDTRLGPTTQSADALLKCMTNAEFEAWMTLVARCNPRVRRRRGRRWDVDAARVLEGLLYPERRADGMRFTIELGGSHWISEHTELDDLFHEHALPSLSPPGSPGAAGLFDHSSDGPARPPLAADPLLWESQPVELPPPVSPDFSSSFPRTISRATSHAMSQALISPFAPPLHQTFSWPHLAQDSAQAPHDSAIAQPQPASSSTQPASSSTQPAGSSTAPPYGNSTQTWLGDLSQTPPGARWSPGFDTFLDPAWPGVLDARGPPL